MVGSIYVHMQIYLVVFLLCVECPDPFGCHNSVLQPLCSQWFYQRVTVT